MGVNSLNTWQNSLVKPYDPGEFEGVERKWYFNYRFNTLKGYGAIHTIYLIVDTLQWFVLLRELVLFILSCQTYGRGVICASPSSCHQQGLRYPCSIPDTGNVLLSFFLSLARGFNFIGLPKELTHWFIDFFLFPPPVLMFSVF